MMSRGSLGTAAIVTAVPAAALVFLRAGAGPAGELSSYAVRASGDTLSAGVPSRTPFDSRVGAL